MAIWVESVLEITLLYGPSLQPDTGTKRSCLMKKPLLAALALSGVVMSAHCPAFAQNTGAQPAANSQAALDQNIELMR